MECNKFKNYIHDLGVLFKEKAREAKHNKDDSLGSDDAGYKIGYLMAFHEVVDIMKQQAMAFGIAQKDVGLADIDAELDLL